jgi:hypothetical protein
LERPLFLATKTGRGVRITSVSVVRIIIVIAAVLAIWPRPARAAPSPAARTLAALRR